jgi:hypothetical protein
LVVRQALDIGRNQKSLVVSKIYDKIKKSMPIVVKITLKDGSIKESAVESGQIFGRAPGSIIINDSMVSAKHAQLLWNSEKNFYTVKDLGSRNRIRTAKGQTVDELPLATGDSFYLGEAQIYVNSITPPAAASVSWTEYFVNFCTRAEAKIKNHPQVLLPFKKAVKVKALSGVQIEDSWTITYGPRSFGAHSLDLILLDPKCPPVAFTLSAKNDLLYFETDHPEVVRLNDKSVSAEMLVGGEYVSIGETLLEIKFLE